MTTRYHCGKLLVEIPPCYVYILPRRNELYQSRRMIHIIDIRDVYIGVAMLVHLMMMWYRSITPFYLGYLDNLTINIHVGQEWSRIVASGMDEPPRCCENEHTNQYDAVVVHGRFSGRIHICYIFVSDQRQELTLVTMETYGSRT